MILLYALCLWYSERAALRRKQRATTDENRIVEPEGTAAARKWQTKSFPLQIKYTTMAFQIGGVSNLRQKNMPTSPVGLGHESDCTNEKQQ
jgi:hypothetical protein